MQDGLFNKHLKLSSHVSEVTQLQENYTQNLKLFNQF